jgi:hypothetical protein
MFRQLKYHHRGLDRLCGLVVRVTGHRSGSPGFDSRRYQIFWVIVGLERGPHSLVRITEELLERKVAAPVYKTEINGRGDPLRWLRDTLYPLKLALTSLTSGGRSVGIVRWGTKATEFNHRGYIIIITDETSSSLFFIIAHVLKNIL